LEEEAIDSIQTDFVNSIFEGKEGKTNELILNRLLNEPGPLNKNQIARRVGKSYGTVHPRIDALKDLGLLEMKDPARKLWGLSALGLWAQARRQPLVLQRCRETISKAWKTFTELYSLDNVKTEFPCYEFLTDWLESDEGLLDFLDTFEDAPLRNEEEALVTFRRMIDWSILNAHTGFRLKLFTSKIERTGITMDPTEALAEIVKSHKLLSTLDEKVRDVDAPLYAYLNKESVETLRKMLPSSIADKLAPIPLFKDQGAQEIAETLRYISPSSIHTALEEAEESIRKRRKDLHYLAIYKIVVQGDKVSIITEDPGAISSRWKESCDLYILRKEENKVIVQLERARRTEK
jgi:DNA-binding transcriptional ArsR family regulator